MKKLFLTLTLFCVALSAANAQNFLAKVPSNSSVVIKYAGDNFNKNVPMQKLDSYNFIKHNFFKMLQIDTLTSLQNIGVNFEQDTYQYITTEDSSLSFVTLLHLNNVSQFLQLIKGTYKAGSGTKTEKKDGFDFISVSPETYIGWNETVAIIVHTTYQNKKNYYDYLYSSDSVTVAVVDSAAANIEEHVAADTAVRFTPPKIVKDKKPTTQKAPATKGKTTAKGKTPAKKPAPKKKYINENYESHIQDSIANVKRELWEQQQEMLAKKKQQWVAEKIMSTTLNGSINSIENEVSYKKIIDPAAHASIWINTESISKQYWNSMYSGAYYFLGNATSKIVKDTTDGYKSSVNIYFEKDKMRMDQKTYCADTKLSALGNAVMNSKQSASLAGYVNPGNIGYFSVSINTEAMANYYYTVMKQYFSNLSYTSEYADIVDIYIDLLQIVIDEKGIADLMPGNYLFVMHDLKTKKVTYTDYEFDKEFNKKEITKTKEELSPDFTFVMETKKDAFLEKIAHLPLKYAEKEKYNYKDKGGYYELAFEEGKYPISSLYFMVKDGKAIVTTSKDVVDMTLKNTGFTVDAATKNSILNNNYSLQLSSKRLLEKLSTTLTTDVSKKISDYLKENLGDLKMESSIKDGMIQGTTTMSITGNHSNSLEFFFNMMDAINNIMEKEQQEKEKQVN